MTAEPLGTYAVEGPAGPRDVELMPRDLLYAAGSAEPAGARIGLFGAPDGVSEIRVAFGRYFTAGDQLFRLDDWAPNPDQPGPEYAGGPAPFRLVVSWFGDAPRGTAPPCPYEITVLHRALPVTPPAGFTVAAATAHGEFGTRGMVVIRIDGAEPYDIGVRYGERFTAGDARWQVDGWLVPDPVGGADTPMVRLVRCDL